VTARYRAGDHLRTARSAVGFLLIGLSSVVSSTVLQGAGGGPGRSTSLIAGLM